MADVDPEEFRRFILDNREIIQSILDEGRGPAEGERSPDAVLEEKLSETKAKVKEMGNGILIILNDDNVQKHFITGCLEFLHFFEAVIDAAPLSPEVRAVVDKMENTCDNAVRNAVLVGTKDRFENITINDVKKRASDSAKSTKEKIESISIRDVKESIAEHIGDRSDP